MNGDRAPDLDEHLGWDLIFPLGEQTAVQPDIRGCPEQGPITLEDTGTWTLVVSADDNDPATGTYTLRLLDEAP